MATGYRSTFTNYAGELFTASREQTPFLSMIGGMNGAKITRNLNFPISSEYTITAVDQPAISELTAADGPPAPKNFTRDQSENTVQIFQESVDVSYVTRATMGMMEDDGTLTFGAENNVADEKDFQIMVTLQKMARDVDYTFLHGAYLKYSDKDTNFTSKGIVTALTSNATAVSDTLSRDNFEAALIDAYDNGAKFIKPVILCGAANKVKFSNIYGYAPEDRNYGGVNIKTIETDFGTMGIVLEPHLDAQTVLIADLAVCKPVFANIPGKAPLFYEDLAKVGATEEGQLFGMLGLDYGPEWMHIKMTSLTIT